eukprot:symbB.v1.2.004756.t1/scaffold242.1/size254583/3
MANSFRGHAKRRRMGDKKTKKKKYTVSSEFKDQLSSLMDVVDLTEPHFIRCIKPNPQNVPDLFDRKGVTEQLRYGGVLQVVQVSRAGYPVRINHQECWDDYKVIGAPKVVSELRHLQDPKIRAWQPQRAQKLLDHLDTELNLPKPKHGQSWAVGKTLVFFKLPAYERMKFARQQPWLVGWLVEFQKLWFPDALQPNSIQSFWFGARRPRDRKLFRILHQKLDAPLRKAERLLRLQPDLSFLKPQHQLLLVIFLDQQSRNARHLLHGEDDNKEKRKEVEDIIESCSQIARQLAERVLFENSTAVDLLEGCNVTAAQLCFFSLTLRHTQRLDDVKRAQELLQELVELQSIEALEVVEAFLKYNSDALARLESQSYVLQAVEQHWPQKMATSQRPVMTRCLAPRCLDGVLPKEEMLRWVEPDCWGLLSSHAIYLELKENLRQHGLLTSSAHLVLSYSGGVDSTAHLLLLLALRHAAADECPSLSCLLMSYPNRDVEEVKAEKAWASWVCHQLQVDFFVYDVLLSRPHGDSGGGLSREEYERYTKEIRFRMYQCLLAECEGPTAVILGHHQDDVDENRLDHLMKGHVLGDVEGMWSWRLIHGVQLFRPLLQRRKDDFVALLHAFPTPHFRDSTPDWSVRGSTRAALDSLAIHSRDELVENLQIFGRLSAEVGHELDNKIQLWSERHVHPLQLPRGAIGIAMELAALSNEQAKERLEEVNVAIEKIRDVWNPLVAAGQFAAISCIPKSLSDIPFLLFEKGFFVAAEGLMSKRPGHYHTSEGISVNRRAVRHLYDNIQACGKPQFSGGLTQELGYLHLAEANVLVLYDASAHPHVDVKTMRSTMVSAVFAVLERSKKKEAPKAALGLELVVKSTTMIQANWRGKVRRRMFVAIRLFVRHVQALLRSKQARADLLQRRCEDSATKIQAHVRSVLAKNKYRSIRKKVIKIQGLLRGVRGRAYAKEYKNHVSATKIQSLVRKQNEQKIYDALRASIVFAQQRFRMRNAKNQLKKLKQEAKEVGAMMAKAQKAAEQASELRKHNEEMEAHQLQLQSENKSLTQKVKQLEENLQQFQQQFEEMRAAAAEAAKLAADNTKTVIEAEKMEAMQKQMSERDEELETVRKELQSMKEMHAKQQEQLKSAEANYKQLLTSTTMQSVGGASAGAGTAPQGGMRHGSRGHRNVFIQLVGSSGTGKTTMLGELVKEHDPSAMASFDDQRSNLMMHHQLQIGSRNLKFLDCSGNERAGHLVKEWFGRTQWVFVIYSLADAKSYEKALTLMAEARQAGAGVVLFANKYDVSNGGKDVVVNLREAHDKATQQQAYSVEGSSLNDAVRFVASQKDQEEPEAPGEGAGDASLDDGKQRSSIANAFDSVKSFAGSWLSGDRAGKGGGVLRPSLKGTKAMKQARREADPNADLRPVQELQDSESAVTCFRPSNQPERRNAAKPPTDLWAMVEHVTGHPPGPSNDGSLAYRLEDYLLSASCLMELNSFAQRHAQKFEDVGPCSPRHDHPHDWYDTFQEYETMMHKRTDEFLHREGVTAEQAVEECFGKRNEGNAEFQYFEYLAAAVDYVRFHSLMLDFKEGRRNLAQWWNCLQLQDD